MDDSLAECLREEFNNEFETAAPTNSQIVENPIGEPSTSTETAIVKIVSNPHSLLVNPKQKGNPLLRSIKNVPWEYHNIVPDYQMGRTVCALFLSLRYHNLNPDYIHERLKQLGKMYELRVLLVQVQELHFSYCIIYLLILIIKR